MDIERIARTIEESHDPDRGPLTSKRVRQMIERAFRVRYCASSARGILHRLGFSYSRKHGWQRNRGTQRSRKPEADRPMRTRAKSGVAANESKPRVRGAQPKPRARSPEVKRRAS